MTLPGVIALGTAASFVGNMFYYYAGKILWNKWGFLKRNFGAKVEATSNIVKRFGSPLMLIARFFYGIRNIIPITLGVYSINVLVFMVYNISRGVCLGMVLHRSRKPFLDSHYEKFCELPNGTPVGNSHFGLACRFVFGGAKTSKPFQSINSLICPKGFGKKSAITNINSPKGIRTNFTIALLCSIMAVRAKPLLPGIADVRRMLKLDPGKADLFLRLGAL